MRRRLRAGRQAAVDARYWFVLRRLEKGSPEEYRAHLEGQLRRTPSKRENYSGVGTHVLVREFARRVPDNRSASVLCIGCRTGYELDRFQRHGLEPVGIDLFPSGQTSR